MIQGNAIEVKNITKKFKVYYDKGHTLKEISLFSSRRKYEERNVLNGISFELREGEAVGLIGQNGCGKSTTLKLLTKIMYPDAGTIEMKGRVSSLLELGAGFHPDMSGRENIYTNASIFGLTRKEIDARLDDIIGFSELEPFIDNPVRTYSSGMYMRLAFAVAINVDADILLIDEILAVGDINFQMKCFTKLQEIKAAGTTIVIVSHSLGQIEQICDRSIWIHDGKIKAMGLPMDVHAEYRSFMGMERMRGRDNEFKTYDASKRWGNGKAQISKIIVTDYKGCEKTVFKTGEGIRVTAYFKVKEKVNNAAFGIAFFRTDGLHCYGTNTQIEKAEKLVLEKDGKFIFEFPHIELLPGDYLIGLAITQDVGDVDYYSDAVHLSIYSEIDDKGLARLSHRIQYDI